MPASSDISKHMRPVDVAAFKAAAKFYSAYVMVRRTNANSIAYVGLAGYTPKRIDCKFKTADHDFVHAGLGRKLKVGGLVVNPRMDPEFHKAYNPAKFSSACEIWDKEWRSVVHDQHSHAGTDAPNYIYIPKGKPYCVYSDPSHEHYGCLRFAASSTVKGGKFIHGDYDLYGIVPSATPEQNVMVPGKMLGQYHNRGKLFMDLQIFVNSRMGVPMVLHGSQEKYTEDFDDEIDLFYPDGERVESLAGVAEIKRLYETVFKGRKMVTGNRELKKLHGDWVEVV